MKLTMFIGSSTKALNRGIVPRLKKRLKNHFDVKPWYELDFDGSFTIQTLLTWTDMVDVALLVFSKDDEIVKDDPIRSAEEPEELSDDAATLRTIKRYIARDNVILEYGLFLAKLGLDRVWLIKESGTTFPSNMEGYNVSQFGTDPLKITSELNHCADQLISRWKTKAPRPLSNRNDTLGILQTVRDAQRRLTEISENLYLAEEEEEKLTHPFLLDSRKACVSTYVEALGKTKDRFWTTTFYSSGFWIERSHDILAANRSLLDRIKQTEAGGVRRLFLLNLSPIEEAVAYRQRLNHLLQQDRRSEVEQLQYNLKALRSNIDYLAGTEVRVAKTSPGEHKAFREKLDFFEPHSHEIAIYDHQRVDFYGGGKSGEISDVRIYSTATQSFNAILNIVESYFNFIWERAAPVDGFLERLEEAHEWAEKRIDYASNWLAIYEAALTKEDAELKTSELGTVTDILHGIGRYGQIRRYLDIGTCTARYPILLRNAAVETGEIIGIDDDDDCVRFATAQIQREPKEGPHIEVRQVDFIGRDFPNLGSFDLVTCMLGTVSHFGWKREKGRDLLRLSVQRMKSLLNEDGLIFISKWSDKACRYHNMLSIYLDTDQKKLADWTPGAIEFELILAENGLEIMKKIPIEERLDLYVLQKAPS